MVNSGWQHDMALEIRENPARFLHEALSRGGFLADAEFKPYAEAGETIHHATRGSMSPVLGNRLF